MFNTERILINVSPGSSSCCREKVVLWGCSKLQAGDPGSQRRATKMIHTQYLLSGTRYLVGEPNIQTQYDVYIGKNQLIE